MAYLLAMQWDEQRLEPTALSEQCILFQNAMAVRLDTRISDLDF